MPEIEEIKTAIVTELASYANGKGEPYRLKNGVFLRLNEISDSKYSEGLQVLIDEGSVELVEHDPDHNYTAVYLLTSWGKNKYKLSVSERSSYISQETRSGPPTIVHEVNSAGVVVNTRTVSKKDSKKQLIWGCLGITLGAVIITLLIVFL